MSVDQAKIMDATRLLLEAIGEDPNREGLKQTPGRVARAWAEFIDYDAGNYETTFEAVQVNQLVIVSGMRVWSFCEHHLLPFWCDVSIGYLTKNHVLGLSKLARISHLYAHRLQLQERLVEEIAAEVMRVAETESVMVVAEGEHSCMVSRGARTPGRMISSSVHGDFRNEPEARAEFLSLVKR